MPDSKLAHQLGRTFEAVKVRRRNHQIENPNPKLIFWTPAEEALRARGFQVASMLCDVCVPQQVDAVVQQTLTAFGTVDH